MRDHNGPAAGRRWLMTTNRLGITCAWSREDVRWATWLDYCTEPGAGPINGRPYSPNLLTLRKQ